MNSTSYNAWKLVSLSPLPAWALALLVIAVLAGVVLAILGVAHEPEKRRKLLLWGLRIGAGLAVLFFLIEPGIRHLQVARMKNRVAVLVDRSASMGFPVEAGGETRSQAVSGYLAAVRPELDALSDRFVVEYYGFDPELAPTSIEQLGRDAPRGGRTDLLSALQALGGGEGSSKKLSGVLLFSDGADNSELASGVSGRARSALEELQIPVSTFLVGQDALKDLSVEQVKVDDFAFVRNSITVEVEIRGRGFGGQEVPVVLRREGQVVASKGVKLDRDQATGKVAFTFTPDQTGRFVYTVSVPVFPDEVVAENNSKSFVLKVIRDRVRVLFVVGRPSWDERYLRGLLKQDPNVDLISFYILRTLADDARVVNQDRELSLIPFPVDEIFDTKLKTFDVVIFQNFGYTDPQLSIDRYEENLEKFVSDHGGGFLIIGGDRSFGEGRATFPTLGRALPVESLNLPANPEFFRPRLTTDGARHPITAIGGGATDNEASWNSLPELPGANMTRAKEGAQVLLEHPAAQVEGKPAPIVAAWDYGRGRSMAVTVDASWYWAFTAHREGQPTRHYDRFWSNALRWLVRDPELTTLRVNADPPSVEPGKPVGAVVTVRLPDYSPAAGAEVEVELRSVLNQGRVGLQKGTAGPDGVVRVEFPPPTPGPYRLIAKAAQGGKDLGTAEDAVAVRAVGPELSDATVHRDTLEGIAKATGGSFFQLPRSGLPDLPLVDPPVVEVGRSQDRPLWDRWYYLLLLIAFLGMEWAARRRFGYI